MAAVPTSERITNIEQRLRAKFAGHEAKFALMPTPVRPAPNASPGEIMLAMAKNAAMGAPADAIKSWGDLFRADVDAQLAELDALRDEGAVWKGIIAFLRGKAAFPPADTAPDLRASAMALKASSDQSAALACARRLELIVDDQVAELDRVKAVWGEKSSIACDIVIAKKSAEFLTRCGENDAAHEFAVKHERLAALRSAMSKRSRRERDSES